MRAPEPFRVATIAALATLLSGRSARAADPFEIQVYDGTANPAGVPSLELHANHVVGTAAPPAPSMKGVTHLTLEPALGITNFWELGAYLQTAIRPDGGFDYAGVKLRSKFVTSPSFHEHLRLGVNFEVSLVPESYDPDRWGAEIRPIAAWEDRLWVFAVNPILGVPLAGSGAREGPDFEPAAMALAKIGHGLEVGLEYYSSLGPIAHPSPIHDQEHYLYEIFNLLSVEHLELNAGIGEGLTPSSNPVVFKVIVGWSFARESGRTSE